MSRPGKKTNAVKMKKRTYKYKSSHTDKEDKQMPVGGRRSSLLFRSPTFLCLLIANFRCHNETPYIPTYLRIHTLSLYRLTFDHSLSLSRKITTLRTRCTVCCRTATHKSSPTVSRHLKRYEKRTRDTIEAKVIVCNGVCCLCSACAVLLQVLVF